MPMLDRRGFTKLFFSGMALVLTEWQALFLSGCANVWDDIIAYAPVGIAAVTNLLNLLGSFGIIPVGTGTAAAALISSITVIWNDVKADVALYQANASATLATKIEAELQQISTQIQQFLAGLNLGTSVQAQIAEALISLILTTISGFISAVAAKAGVPVPAAKAMSRRTLILHSAAGTHTLLIEPTYRNRSTFEKQWNAEVDKAGHTESELH